MLDDNLLRSLANPVIFKKLGGNPEQLHIDMHYVVSDGRSRQRIIKSLIEDGYLGPRKPDESRYPLTEKAYNEIEPKRPVISFDDMNGWQRQRPGKAFNDLSLAEQKFVIENQNEYSFWLWQNYQEKAVPFHIGDPGAWSEYRRNSLSQTFYVATPEYFEAQTDFEQAERLQSYASRNLSWGLRALGHISSDQRDVFESGTRDSIFESYHFGGVPEKWGARLEEFVAKLPKEIAELQRRLAIYVETQEKVNAAGGWEKFLQEYGEKLKLKLVEEDETTRKP